MEHVIIFLIFIIFALYIIRQHRKFLKKQYENNVKIHKYIDSIDIQFFSVESSIVHVDIDMKE